MGRGVVDGRERENVPLSWGLSVIFVDLCNCAIEGGESTLCAMRSALYCVLVCDNRRESAVK